MTLRWYQREAVDAAWGFLCDQQGNPLLALPTGSGKSHILGALAIEAVQKWQGQVLILTEQKELIEQNASKIAGRGVKVGIYCAGLGRRDTEHPIILASIQSIYKRGLQFGRRHLVIIDEAHNVPHEGEGRYKQLFADLEKSGGCKVVGLTATPYRMDQGQLCRPDGVFRKVAYSAPIPRLLEEGYLCPLVTKPVDQISVEGLAKNRKGDYQEAEAAERFRELHAIPDLIAKCEGRNSVLVFTSSVAHAEETAAEIAALTGQETGLIVGTTPKDDRASTIHRFRAQKLRWLVNCNVLTTGFDAPCIDAIAVLRATLSPGLFAQMAGRGFRVDAGKRDCLILDYGRNIETHGPLDSPDYGVQGDKLAKKAKEKGIEVVPGEVPLRTCPNCGIESTIDTTECECGWSFQISDRAIAALDSVSSDNEILNGGKKVRHTWDVRGAVAVVHQKKGGKTSMRVDYECVPEGFGDALNCPNIERISEWICVEHEGYAKGKAQQWWQMRCKVSMPCDAEEAVREFNRGVVAKPSQITTEPDGKYTKIVSAVLDPIPEYHDAENEVDWDEIPF